MELRDRPMDPMTHLVVLKGELDAGAAGELEACLAAIRDQGKRYIIVDLTGLEVVGAAGLRTFVAAGFELAQKGGKLVLHSMTTPVREAFDLAGLSSLFAVTPSREAAVATVAKLRG